MCGTWSSAGTQLKRATELEVTDLKTTQRTSQAAAASTALSYNFDT